MDPTNFLNTHVYGYSELSPQEHQAIAAFSLLWSAMEGRLFADDMAKPALLIETATRMVGWGLPAGTSYQESLAYFKARYFRDGEFTYHFNQLHFRRHDKKELVEAVLTGTESAPESELAALLLIVYRLRNNLFHGAKWAYGIRGQLDNFTHGASIIMLVIQAHQPQ